MSCVCASVIVLGFCSLLSLHGL